MPDTQTEVRSTIDQPPSDDQSLDRVAAAKPVGRTTVERDLPHETQQAQQTRRVVSLIQQSEHVGELLVALVKATLGFDEIDVDLTADVVPKGGGRGYKYNYASLKRVNQVVRRPLAEQGLILMHGSKVMDKNALMVETKLWHVSEQWMSIMLPVAIFGGAAQDVGGGLSYAKRYNILALLNLSPGAEDPDGGDNEQETRTYWPTNDPPQGGSADVFDSILQAGQTPAEAPRQPPKEVFPSDVFAAGKAAGWSTREVVTFVEKHFKKKPTELARGQECEKAVRRIQAAKSATE